jgi:hypothetical protein
VPPHIGVRLSQAARDVNTGNRQAEQRPGHVGRAQGPGFIVRSLDWSSGLAQTVEYRLLNRFSSAK